MTFICFFGVKVFNAVWFLFSFVSDYGTSNQSEMKENKNLPGLKVFSNQKKNLYPAESSFKK